MEEVKISMQDEHQGNEEITPFTGFLCGVGCTPGAVCTGGLLCI